MNNITPARKWVKVQLEKIGYEVEEISPNTLRVNDCLQVEVRESRENTRNYVSKTGAVRQYPVWQTNVSNIDLTDKVIVFVARDSLGIRWPVVVPGDVAEQRPSLAISSHPSTYKGYLCAFLNNWDVIETMLYRKIEGVRNV